MDRPPTPRPPRAEADSQASVEHLRAGPSSTVQGGGASGTMAQASGRTLGTCPVTAPAARGPPSSRQRARHRHLGRGCQAGTVLSPSLTGPLAVAPGNPEQPVGLSLFHPRPSPVTPCNAAPWGLQTSPEPGSWSLCPASLLGPASSSQPLRPLCVDGTWEKAMGPRV